MPPPSQRQQRKRARLNAPDADPASPAKKPQVAITDVKAVAVQEPGGKRAYVIVSLSTDSGLTGIGEASARPDAQTAVQNVLQNRQHLVGQDALAGEAMRRRLLRASAPPNVVAAVNLAMLDILGKAAKAPAYEVLGGPTRSKARALAHVHGPSKTELTESVQRAHQAGYRAFLVSLHLEGTRGPTFHRQVADLLDGLRGAVGGEGDFVLDGAGGLTPGEAAGLARQIERLHPLFLDEPCSQTTAQALRRITEETVVPLGLGRDAVQNQAFQEWLRAQVVDVLRPNLALLGISEARKAAALAETYYTAVAPFHRGGPVGTAAALQLAAALPNFFIQEVPVPADERDRRMRRELTAAPTEEPQDGFLPLPTAPGLGVVLNNEAIEKYRLK